MKNIILLLLLTTLLKATGPSYANIRLMPIATHENGEVLFRTYRNINGLGGSSLKDMQIGWLVVSSKGVWDEQVAIKGYEYNDFQKLLETLSKYGYDKVNLKSPDAVLKKLMLKYNFTKDTPLILEKFKRLELKPKQSCFMGSCIDDVLIQQTVDGYVSKGVTKPIKGSYYKGVVLFSNDLNDEEYRDGAKAKGAIFNLPPYYIGEHDVGYDIVHIDGILILTEGYLKKFEKSRK